MLESSSVVLIGIDLAQFDKNDADTLVGVIARSAGVWDSKCLPRSSLAVHPASELPWALLLFRNHG